MTLHFKVSIPGVAPQFLSFSDSESMVDGLNARINNLGLRMQPARVQPEFSDKWSLVAGSFIVGTIERVE